MYIHVSRELDARFARRLTIELRGKFLRDRQLKIESLLKLKQTMRKRTASGRHRCSVPFKWTPYMRRASRGRQRGTYRDWSSLSHKLTF